MEFLALVFVFFLVCGFSWWITNQHPDVQLDRKIEEKWKVRYFKRSLLKLDLYDSKSYEDDYLHHF